jgi:hypothetical protein
MKKESQQLDISLSLTNGEEHRFILSRFATGIGQPRPFECQFLPTVKGANSPKMKLFDAMACLEPNLVEFGHAIDQSGQAVIHRRLIPFILNDRWKQELVTPRCGFVHIHQDPPFLGSFPTTFEGSQDIFVTAVATQREPDSAIDDFGISRGRVIIPEQTGVRHDSKPTFIEHYKSTQRRDSIGVKVEQLTVQVAHDGYQKLAGWKSQSGNQMGLKADGGRVLNSGNVYLRNGGDYITSKPATLVVGLALTVSDRCFIEEVL